MSRFFAILPHFSLIETQKEHLPSDILHQTSSVPSMMLCIEHMPLSFMSSSDTGSKAPTSPLIYQEGFSRFLHVTSTLRAFSCTHNGITTTVAFVVFYFPITITLSVLNISDKCHWYLSLMSLIAYCAKSDFFNQKPLTFD